MRVRSWHVRCPSGIPNCFGRSNNLKLQFIDGGHRGLLIMLLTYPHRKKSSGVTSDECGGHGNGPSRSTQRPGKCMLRNSRPIRAQCGEFTILQEHHPDIVHSSSACNYTIPRKIRDHGVDFKPCISAHECVLLGTRDLHTRCLTGLYSFGGGDEPRLYTVVWLKNDKLDTVWKEEIMA
jgi:hypothetical protein